MTPPTIHYELEGMGWARLTLTSGDKQLVFEDLSYLDEPLHDLLRAALYAALRRLPPTLQFDNESAGFSRMTFECPDIDEPPALVELVISYSRRSDDGETGWSEPSSLSMESDAFARAVLACAEGVLARYGVEDYGLRWFGEGFPLRALEALRGALSVSDPLGPKYREDLEPAPTAPS